MFAAMIHLGRTNMVGIFCVESRKVTDRKLKKPVIGKLKKNFFKCFLHLNGNLCSDSRHISLIICHEVMCTLTGD